MGRNKVEIMPIEDQRSRRITFKKRRFGLLKKVMQLATLSNCNIELRVYNNEDSSLLEYVHNSQPLPKQGDALFSEIVE